MKSLPNRDNNASIFTLFLESICDVTDDEALITDVNETGSEDAGYGDGSILVDSITVTDHDEEVVCCGCCPLTTQQRRPNFAINGGSYACENEISDV